MSNSFATHWTITHQAPLSMGFPRHKYCSGLPFPTPRDLPDPGIKPASPALASWLFTTVLFTTTYHLGSPCKFLNEWEEHLKQLLFQCSSSGWLLDGGWSPEGSNHNQQIGIFSPNPYPPEREEGLESEVNNWPCLCEEASITSQ